MSNVKMIQDLYAAFGRGDIEAVLGALDAKVEWREAEGNPYQPTGEAFVGPESVLKNLFVRLGEDWTPFVVNTQSFHDAGDTVVMEGRYTGTHKATGKSLDAQVCHVWKVRGGKVTSFQQYVDTAQLREVMGAS
ncbi:MAG: nuclear transport factor 2 family protein [Planctomycetota bacterium]